MSNACVLGVDPSLTGFAAYELGSSTLFELATKPKDFSCFPARLEHILREFTRFLEDIPHPSLAAIEGMSMGSKSGSKSIEMGAVHQIARLALWRAGIDYVEVPPSTLKKFICGNGAAEKNLMLREVFKRWGYDAKGDDAADAYALARLAEHYTSSPDGTWTKATFKALKQTVKACTLVEGRRV